MSDVATTERNAQHAAEEQAKKDAAAAEAKVALIAKQQASITPEEQRAFDALEDSEQQRRAALSLSDQKMFDARQLVREQLYGATRAERQIAFGALSTEQRSHFLGTDAKSGEAPTQQHIDEEFFAELVYLKLCNLPLSEHAFNEIVHRFKLMNVEPAGDAQSQSTRYTKAK